MRSSGNMATYRSTSTNPSGGKVLGKDQPHLCSGPSWIGRSAICRGFNPSEEYTSLILRTRAELDLTNGAEVSAFFDREQPEYVFLAAAKSEVEFTTE